MDRQEILAAATQMRRDTADWLEGLDEAQLDTPSLCSEWAVRDVAGHLLAALTLSLPAMFWRTARIGMNPHRANITAGRELGARSGPQLAADLRRLAGTEMVVPFVGAHGPFTDLIVHNADMRIPLGAPWQPDTVWVLEALEFLLGGAVGFTSRRRLAGLRFVATDASLTRGEGAEVSGPAYPLALAVCGRRPGLEALHGPGRDLLASRI